MRILPGIMLALAILCAGCGGDSGLVPVIGQVTFNGKPLQGVGVTFDPLDGSRPSTGQTNANGQYRLYFTLDQMGASPGAHQVKLDIPSGIIKVGREDAEAAVEGGYRWPQDVTVSPENPTWDFEVSEIKPKTPQ